MIKILMVSLALCAAPLLAQDGGAAIDASKTAKLKAMDDKAQSNAGGSMMKDRGKVMDQDNIKAAKAAKAHNPRGAHKEHWVCPMGDGGESDHAGPCPKCGMDLVLDKAYLKGKKK